MTPEAFAPGTLRLASMAGDTESQAYLAAAESAAFDIPGIDADQRPRALAKIGVVGAGTMGRGIAISCANAGLSVQLIDTNRQAMERAMPAIRATYDRAISRGRLTAEEAERRLSRISAVHDLETLADRDCVIEAVFESLTVKQVVFRKLDAICRSGAILATNTSTLDVDAIAAVTKRPQDVIGLHFFAPAHVMRMVEIVRGAKTSADVVASSLALARKLDKVGVVVGVCFGFVGNRMGYVYGTEASRLLLEGATPQQIDSTLERFGYAMGPYAVGDLSGLDVDWRVRQEMQLTDEQQKLALIDDALIERGRLGQKSGAGFYRYPNGPSGPREADPEVDDVIVQIAKSLGVRRTEKSEAEILERCLLTLINEGGRILDDKIALRAGDIDLIFAHGLGFPKRFGGPMRLASLLGIRRVVQALEGYEALLGPRFSPATSLREAANQTCATSIRTEQFA